MGKWWIETKKHQFLWNVLVTKLCGSGRVSGGCELIGFQQWITCQLIEEYLIIFHFHSDLNNETIANHEKHRVIFSIYSCISCNVRWSVSHKDHDFSCTALVFPAQVLNKSYKYVLVIKNLLSLVSTLWNKWLGPKETGYILRWRETVRRHHHFQKFHKLLENSYNLFRSRIVVFRYFLYFLDYLKPMYFSYSSRNCQNKFSPFWIKNLHWALNDDDFTFHFIFKSLFHEKNVLAYRNLKYWHQNIVRII